MLHTGRRTKFRSPPLLVVVVTGLITGCNDPVDPAAQLIVSFEMEPRAVHAGDSLRAILTILNPAADTIVLGSGSACVNTLRVFHDGEPVFMRGANYGCLDVVSRFPIPPNGVLQRDYDLIAYLLTESSPFEYVVPPPPGTYVAMAVMQVQLDDIDAEFSVMR